jgi:hypothetical protein
MTLDAMADFFLSKSTPLVLILGTDKRDKDVLCLQRAHRMGTSREMVVVEISRWWR